MRNNRLSRLVAAPTLLAFASLTLSTPAGAEDAESPPAAPPPSADTPAAAPAPTGESCSAAYERAQTEKLAGHYVASSAAALECSQLGCNPAIVRECVRFYEALEQDTPKLVFSARKAEGGELFDVRVEVDGQLAAERITGRPYAVDPGPHQFVFIHSQRGRVELSETARVGDRARVIEATFTDPNAKSQATPGAAAGADKPRHPVPVMTYVLGGVGLAALGTFVYFRTRAVNDYNDYNGSCSPHCNPNDIDDVKQKFTFSYVALGVGAASLAGAGLVFLLTPRQKSVPAVQANVVPEKDGAMVRLRTTF